MTATENIILRTGADEATAEKYESVARDAVMFYLGYKTTDGLERFYPAIADLAVVYMRRDRDTAEAEAEAGKGIKKESFTEGSVSESKEYITSYDIATQYETQEAKILHGLDRFRRARVISGVTKNVN